MKILIKNATIVNADKEEEADLLINGDKILSIGKGIGETADKEIDAGGKFVFPGFIDMHAHLRTPGREDEEDLASGSYAAAKGGFTKVFCMPNTQPCLDNEGLAEWICEQSRNAGIVDIYPVGAITKNREGKELTEFGALKRAGCLSLSDDGDSLGDTLLLRRALEYAKMFDILIISHCEDARLANKGAMRESAISSKYGVAAIPSIAESLIVARDIEMAQYLNSRIHLAHISTAKSVEIIKRAKEKGVKVSCETCPHYFVLSVEDVENSKFDGNFKVNPPLGEKEDIETIKQALKDGVIDCIATDHAPHSRAEKELPFENSSFGFIGLELAFSLTYTYLVKKGVIDLKGLVEKLSFNPSRILNLGISGAVREGNEASLVIADLNRTWRVTEDSIVSKSKNTPFIGYELNGVIEKTIYKGNIVYNADNS